MSGKYSSHSAGNSSAKLGAAIAVAAVTVAGMAWWLTRPPVQLNEHQYATSIALYRVCNQRSDTGLDQIEALLKSSGAASDNPSSSHRALQAIIADARQGRWQRAAVNCRRLLDDQVQR